MGIPIFTILLSLLLQLTGLIAPVTQTAPADAIMVEHSECQTITGTPQEFWVLRNMTGKPLTLFSVQVDHSQKQLRVEQPSILQHEEPASTDRLPDEPLEMVYTGCSGQNVLERLRNAFPAYRDNIIWLY